MSKAMRDFNKNQMRREDKAFKNLWNPPRRQAPPVRQQPRNNSSNNFFGGIQSQPRAPSGKIIVEHRHRYPSIDPYDDPLYPEPPIVVVPGGSSIGWNGDNAGLAFILIIFAVIIYALYLIVQQVIIGVTNVVTAVVNAISLLVQLVVAIIAIAIIPLIFIGLAFFSFKFILPLIGNLSSRKEYKVISVVIAAIVFLLLIIAAIPLEISIYNSFFNKTNSVVIAGDNIGPEITGSSINGACGVAINSCASGSFEDKPDSSTYYLWNCNGSSGGANQNCNSPIPDTSFPPIKTQSPLVDPKLGTWVVQIPVAKIENNGITLAGQGEVTQLPWLRSIAYQQLESNYDQLNLSLDWQLTNKYTVAFLGLNSGDMAYNSEDLVFGLKNVTTGKDISNITFNYCGQSQSYRIPAIIENTWYRTNILVNKTNNTANLTIVNPATSDLVFGPPEVNLASCPNFDRIYIGTRGKAPTYFSNFKISSTNLNEPSTIDLAAGLVSYWSFDENSNEVKDNIGTNTGVASGITYNSEGKKNGAYEFNGTTSKVLFKDSSSLKSGIFSLSLWFKSNSGAEQTLFWDETNRTVAATEGFMTTLKNGQINFYLGIGGSKETILPASNGLNDNTWHNLILTYDGSIMKVYVDGQLSGTKSSIGKIAFANENKIQVGMGYINSAAWGPFNGSMDEIKYWNRALNSKEITEVYSKP